MTTAYFRMVQVAKDGEIPLMPFESEESGHDVSRNPFARGKIRPGSCRNSGRRRRIFGPMTWERLRHEAIRVKGGRGKHQPREGNCADLMYSWNY